jgi:hypothetical protein
MIRTLKLALASAALIATAGAAHAEQYCCWNKAICNAVCGSACCGQNFSSGGNSSSSLNRFSKTDLMAELSRVKGNAPFKATLSRAAKRAR